MLIFPQRITIPFLEHDGRREARRLVRMTADADHAVSRALALSARLTTACWLPRGGVRPERTQSGRRPGVASARRRNATAWAIAAVNGGHRGNSGVSFSAAPALRQIALNNVLHRFRRRGLLVATQRPAGGLLFVSRPCRCE